MCPSVFEADLPPIAYEDAQTPEEAHRRMSAALQRAPIAMGQRGPEILSYELVRSVLRDSRFGVPRGFFLAAQGVTSGRLWDRFGKSLPSLEGAEHHRLRRCVSPSFGPRSLARLDTMMTELMSGLVDPLISVGRCDVVEDIARRYPIPVICALIGAPLQDWRLFSGWADAIFMLFTWRVAGNEDVIMKAYDELDAYIVDMVDQRAVSPGDDLISELITVEEDGDRLTREELCGVVSVLLSAGTDTTRNQLSAAVQVLCDYPEQWALLADQPQLMPAAVEELMRHTPIALSTIRQAYEDVELGGVVFPAGTLVIVNTAAANRDPDVYENPNRLDVARDNPAPMLTFGSGLHLCLGANLARAELVAALRVMTQRMLNPRLAGPAPWKPFTPITGPLALPIDFDIEAGQR
ncbi:Vitamin D(3) 25-hydroxylase [Mycobacterium basiliense]|uniref:Vitamin D(3) 25-hydroxylase n=1 Tax=Mycobacterium basiliense TaxID=2094119 RepID=A0A3S4BEA1_9MYCO|nr:cytochrome P450 [Mycobacterium basiliense]VDM88776.1 Vitamin D(3) 25-hydroxylase [Mycobacterium basiliense]